MSIRREVNLFDWFKKKKEPEFNFSTIGTDMHSHIIPGIDDGARNLQDALVLARRFMDMGFNKLIVITNYFI